MYSLSSLSENGGKGKLAIAGFESSQAKDKHSRVFGKAVDLCWSCVLELCIFFWTFLTVLDLF